mmetsp:Transcript_71815/g.203731  ORF Transcript_71815/g.203731 Transcript_71815/m.203731 type:complete len:239 (+) Transcript_71815:2623-3339(+)
MSIQKKNLKRYVISVSDRQTNSRENKKNTTVRMMSSSTLEGTCSATKMSRQNRATKSDSMLMVEATLLCVIRRMEVATPESYHPLRMYTSFTPSWTRVTICPLPGVTDFRRPGAPPSTELRLTSDGLGLPACVQLARLARAGEDGLLDTPLMTVLVVDWRLAADPDSLLDWLARRSAAPTAAPRSRLGSAKLTRLRPPPSAAPAGSRAIGSPAGSCGRCLLPGRGAEGISTRRVLALT